MLLDKESSEAASQFVRDKIKETVKDAETAELLTPYYPV